jgi:hypothetical protein
MKIVMTHDDSFWLVGVFTLRFWNVKKNAIVHEEIFFGKVVGVLKFSFFLWIFVFVEPNV